VTGTAVRGIVHNIGSKDISEVTVAIVDEFGDIVAGTGIGAIPAPPGLGPRRRRFSITLPEGGVKGRRLVVDPHDSVPGIHGGNNSVVLTGGEAGAVSGK